MIVEIFTYLEEKYRDWVFAVENRIETEQYFVATVYAFGGIILALAAFAAFVGIIMAFFGVIGWLLLVFVCLYLYFKEYGKRLIQDDEVNSDEDDEDPPSFV